MVAAQPETMKQMITGFAAGYNRYVRDLKAGGERALAVMEQQLKCTPYLCGEAPTIADIALYAYTHVAEEGIFSLQGWPGASGWVPPVTRSRYSSFSAWRWQASMAPRP